MKLQSSSHGFGKGGSRLSEEDVVNIRQMAVAGVTYVEIGEMYGISRTNAGNIAQGLVWKDAPGPITPTQDAPGSIGERCPSSILTLPRVRAIWKYWKLGLKKREIASRVGVSDSSVGRVLNGKAWKHARPVFTETNQYSPSHH